VGIAEAGTIGNRLANIVYNRGILLDEAGEILVPGLTS